MSIFRRKPKFKAGDGVEVTSLCDGLYFITTGTTSVSRSYVGAWGIVRDATPGFALVSFPGDGMRVFHDWELRHA